MKHYVTCPVEKVREMILEKFPDHYKSNNVTRLLHVDFFVQPIHHIDMLDYMDRTREESEVE